MKYRYRSQYLWAFSFCIAVIYVLALLSGCGGGSSGSGGGSVTPTPSSSPGLDANTAYYWQVEACSSSGYVTTGPQWSFTTGSKSKAMSSQTLTMSEALETASNFISGQQARKNSSIRTEKSITRTVKTSSMRMIKSADKSADLAYVADLEPCGYVVIPCGNSLPPVLAYSFDSDFDMSENSGNILLNMIRRDISLRKKAEAEGRISASVIAENRAKRAELLNSEKNTAKDGTIWGPLFSFGTWSQEAPYNYDCPMDPETGLQTVVGCVATSLSQHLNYWQTPTSVSFTSSDNYTTATRKIYVEAANAGFSGLNYNNSNPSAEARAQLSYACAVLVKMDFTSDESGASMATLVNRLKDRLGYSSAYIVSFYNTPFSSTDIITNLKSGVPVFLGINDEDMTKGHALNTDGYDESNNTFHLSCGWAGRSDGWYVLPDGMPEGFSVVSQAVLNAYPDGTEPIPSPTVSPSPSPTGAPSAPENPWPSNGLTGVSTESYLYWFKSTGADYYNIYIWKAGENKPSQPSSSNLTQPGFKPQNN
ncbi:MAG: C10 family peptidase [Firmicutes bacterium]|nr:C10 family peptidase [Bacillota bacterium]